MRLTLFSLLLTFCSVTFLQAQPIINPEINRVLVDPVSNDVHIYFSGTDHPDVTHYKISQWMIIGGNPFTSGVPIEASSTVHTGASEYHWTSHIQEVLSEPVGFTVGAYNSSDEPINQSHPPDSTIYLAAEYDSCEASVSLHWNDYNAWRGKILEYEINGSNTDGSFTVLARVPEGTTDTVISGLQAYNQYLFFIIARENRLFSNAYVTSNGVSFSTPHAYYPEFIHADYGTVNNANRPQLKFTIDSRSELNKFMLKRSENPAGPFTLIDSINSSESIIEYTDENVDAASRPYYYTIAAINFCDEEITTSENIAGTIFLSGQAEGNRVNIEWTPYHEWTTGISEYDVERSLSGGAFEVINETNTTSYTDDSFNELIGQDVNSEVCYRITAYEAPGSPHSSGQASSSSNILCVSLPMNLRFDYNAFVPGLEGYSEFGPVMDFLPGYFRFEIYNRAGTKVYESSDPYNPTWDGRYDRGDIVTEGVYRYQLEYEDENGKRVVLNGNVSVVRK